MKSIGTPLQSVIPHGVSISDCCAPWSVQPSLPSPATLSTNRRFANGRRSSGCTLSGSTANAGFAAWRFAFSSSARALPAASASAAESGGSHFARGPP